MITHRDSEQAKENRKTTLQRDPWVVASTIRPYSVECAACRKRIPLVAIKTYVDKEWVAHRTACSVIQEKVARGIRERNGIMFAF